MPAIFTNVTKKRLAKGFTLVEMLIVIVIIGILVAALVPRFSGAQGKARDIARKSNLAQISTALAVYANDNGVYPQGNGGCVPVGSELTTYLTTVPRDPQGNRITEPCNQPGVYAYVPLRRGGVENAGMAVMASVENENQANFMWDGSITPGADAEAVQAKMCQGKCAATGGKPYYVIIQ